MYERSAQLLEDAFHAYENVPIIRSGTKLMIYEKNKSYYGIVKDDFAYPLLEEEKQHLEVCTCPISNNKNQEVIGQFSIYLSKRLLFSGNLYKL